MLISLLVLKNYLVITTSIKNFDVLLNKVFLKRIPYIILNYIYVIINIVIN